MFNKKILPLIEINFEHQGLNYLRKGAICVLSYFITYIIISYHVSTSILSYTVTASIPDYTSESASFVSQCFPEASDSLFLTRNIIFEKWTFEPHLEPHLRIRCINATEKLTISNRVNWSVDAIKHSITKLFNMML